MRRLHTALWLSALLLAGCLPFRVSFGPGGRVGTPNAVYKTRPDGSLEPDLETMRRVLAGKPDGEDYNFHTLWSPDEKRIAVFYQSKNANSAAVVTVYSWPGFEERWSARLAPGYVLGPRFSPDGRWLSFVHHEAEPKEGGLAEGVGGRLYVVGDDGKPRELARNTSLFHDWKPTGERIAVLVRGAGHRPGELGLGSLLVIDARTGESKALLGTAFDEAAAVQWSGDGTIDFAMPEIRLPIDPKKIKETRSSIYRTRVAGGPSEPHAPVLAASAFPEPERIYAFRRAPGARERYVVVTARGDEDPSFRAYLYEPGPQARPRRITGTEPAEYAVPFWLDAETFGLPVDDGYYRGKVAGGGAKIRSAVSGDLFPGAAEGLAKLDGALEQIAELSSFLDRADQKKLSEEERAVQTILIEAVRVGALEPEQRPLAILVVGRMGGDDARAALQAAARDETALEGKRFGKNLTVADFARMAIARLDKGTPYPKDKALLLRLFP